MSYPSPVEYLLNARALANGQAYVPSEWQFYSPVVETDPNRPYGFRLTMQAMPLSGKYGKFHFHYDKADMASLGTVIMTGPVTIQDQLDLLSDVYGVAVTQVDFSQPLVQRLSVGTFTHTVAGLSTLFQGTLTLKIV